MKKLIPILIAAALFSCKKDNDNNRFGCVYGVNKSTGLKQYIFCVHKEIYIAGSNQAAADKISAIYDLPKVNVQVRQLYSNTEFIPNAACDCN